MVESGMNRNKWTTTAIVEKLERDGYIQSKDNSDQAANTDDDKLPCEEWGDHVLCACSKDILIILCVYCRHIIVQKWWTVPFL